MRPIPVSAASLCSTRDAWGQIAHAIHGALDGIILADLVERTHNLLGDVENVDNDVSEGSPETPDASIAI